MPFWAVVRAVPHHDRLAAECVALAGFETFTPKIRVNVESRWRTQPLFAGYFFTRIVDRWRVLERTMGVLWWSRLEPFRQNAQTRRSPS